MDKTEDYVLSLLEEVLGAAERSKRFEWGLGDVSPKTGRRVQLPFDAVLEDRKLIVEMDEVQWRRAFRQPSTG